MNNYKPRLVETEENTNEDDTNVTGFAPLNDESESENEVLVPDPPELLSFEAKCEWINCAKDLQNKGKLVGGVMSLLEAYCIAMGHVREFEKTLQTDGMIIGGRPHPAYKMMLDSMTQVSRFGSELGFGKKVVVDLNKKEEESDWDKDKSLLA